jgi:2-polyprenyl-3-methyl-5-hydroxy-6-metoxy-1,4-benzoquinol methylase
MSSNNYILGHTSTELERLNFQSQMLEPVTTRMLLAANIRPGMRILDVGCGTGGASLLAASMTGSTGSVLGIDRSDKAIVAAQARAEAALTANIKFIASSIDDFSVEGQQFDMVIGRYVLCHQSDAVAFLKRTAKFVRRGGVRTCHGCS